MNSIAMVIIFVLFLCFLGFQGAKKFVLSNLDKSVQKKDYNLTVQLSDMSMSRRLLGDYICDLYKIRAYYLDRNTDKFDQMLQYVIKKDYKNVDDKKDFLVLYYHIFLIKKNKKYTDILLDAIKKDNNENFIKYNQQAYEVMINERNDLIEEMDKQIDSKKFYGFSLGVILYMIAIQYERLGDIKLAVTYFQNAIVCFLPTEKYVALSKEHINKLNKSVVSFSGEQNEI